MSNVILAIEEDYTLFGIRSNLEDFSLVYFLNKKLNLNLSREEKDISFVHSKKNIFFSLFSCYDEESDNNWSLIKNETTFENHRVNDNNLFGNEKVTMLMCLIPEYKNFDFLIKINGLVFNKKEIISLVKDMRNVEIISEIPIIEGLSVQSKGNLCF